MPCVMSTGNVDWTTCRRVQREEISSQHFIKEIGDAETDKWIIDVENVQNPEHL